MDQIDEIYRDRLAAIWRVLYATKYARNDNVPCQIEEGLYLGSLGAANNKTALKSQNVTHILTVAGSLAPSHPNDFVYKVIEISDKVDVDISRYFEECFNFIEEGKKAGGVLVHCFVGKSRSVTIVVAYLMKKHGMRLSEALEHVRSKRPIASPNSGFISQLKSFERGHIKSAATASMTTAAADWQIEFHKCSAREKDGIVYHAVGMLQPRDTTSSSRIFIKILFQELSEHLSDPTTRYSINFFTSIGLGGIIKNLREYLKNMPRLIMHQQKPSPSSSESGSSSLSESASSSSSGSESSPRSDESDSDSAIERGVEVNSFSVEGIFSSLHGIIFVKGKNCYFWCWVLLQSLIVLCMIDKEDM